MICYSDRMIKYLIEKEKARRLTEDFLSKVKTDKTLFKWKNIMGQPVAELIADDGQYLITKVNDHSYYLHIVRF